MIEFDPTRNKTDPNTLYSPRVHAHNAIRQHLDSVEQASASWLQTRKMMTMRNLGMISEESFNRSQQMQQAQAQQNLSMPSSSHDI